MFDATKLTINGFPPTLEQRAIIDAFLTGKSLVIEAGAGAGKTSTLKFLGMAAPEKKGIYFAYNKAIADDAKRSFPENVKCSTAHALAYYEVIIKDKALGAVRRRRLEGPRVPSWKSAQILSVTQDLRVSKDKVLKKAQVARLALDAVDNFCTSANDEVLPHHVPWVEGLTLDERDDLREEILPIARQAWNDITSRFGNLKFNHDHYLKIWQLSHPKLSGDFVMLDEAQDANPVIAAIVDEQTHMQRILVGDQNQAIYGWRGAVDAMKNFQGERLQLTQSFRFGQAIADEANKWLTHLQSTLKIRGFEKVQSVLQFSANPDAILCRTNSGAINEVIAQRKLNKKVALVGGGNALKYLAEAARDLQAGNRTEHPELFLFESWDDVVDYANNDAAGADLKVFVKMVGELGIPAILQACDGLTSEEDADIVISTAHKAKGREWNIVRIASDFREPKEAGQTVSREEMMLAYVTVTRAKFSLDVGGLAFVDRLPATTAAA